MAGLAVVAIAAVAVLLASAGIAARASPAGQPVVVSPRCEAEVDAEQQLPRERQPFCTFIHCY